MTSVNVPSRLFLYRCEVGALPAGHCASSLRAVGEIDVQPAIVVVIEEGQAASLGFDDVALVVGSAPDVGDGESGFFCHINELRPASWLLSWSSSLELSRVSSSSIVEWSMRRAECCPDDREEPRKCAPRT